MTVPGVQAPGTAALTRREPPGVPARSSCPGWSVGMIMLPKGTEDHHE